MTTHKLPSRSIIVNTTRMAELSAMISAAQKMQTSINILGTKRLDKTKVAARKGEQLLIQACDHLISSIRDARKTIKPAKLKRVENGVETPCKVEYVLNGPATSGLLGAAMSFSALERDLMALFVQDSVQSNELGRRASSTLTAAINALSGAIKKVSVILETAYTELQVSRPGTTKISLAKTPPAQKNTPKGPKKEAAAAPKTPSPKKKSHGVPLSADIKSITPKAPQNTIVVDKALESVKLFTS